jgi:adenylate cyclase
VALPHRGSLRRGGTAWAAFELWRPHRLSGRRLATALALALVVTALTLLLRWLGWLDFPEMQLLDWRFRARGPRATPAQVRILALDDRTMNGARRLSPVPRDLLASLVRRLADGGARAIVLDVELFGRLGAEDTSLRSAMLEAGNVILPALLANSGHVVLPDPYFRAVAAGVGIAHVEEAAVDHTVRWERPVWVGGRPSLALAASTQAARRDLGPLLDASGPATLGRLLGRSLDGEGRMLINWVGPQGVIPRISGADLLNGNLPPDRIRDRIVVVGATWSEAGDLHFVPFSSWRAGPTTSLMPGVEIQANAIVTLMEPPPGDAPLRPTPAGTNLAVLFGIALLASLATVLFNPTAAAILTVALAGIWTWLGLRLFVVDHVVALMAPPLAATLLAYLTAALVTERRAQHLRRHFRRYVGRAVADQLAEMSDRQIGRMGRTRVVTLLFADMRGYTRRSRALEPEGIVRFLNRYFERMTAAAMAAGGFVDKYVGDELMAIFGMFDADREPLRSALAGARAALVMRRVLHALRASDPDFRGVSVGIGLHTGQVVIGEVGTPDKTEFTAIGSAVNLASRIEDQTRRLFQERQARGDDPAAIILMSETTRSFLADQVIAEPTGEVVLRGLEDEEIRLWELLDEGAPG